jgi:hypothetical protein
MNKTFNDQEPHWGDSIDNTLNIQVVLFRSESGRQIDGSRKSGTKGGARAECWCRRRPQHMPCEITRMGNTAWMGISPHGSLSQRSWEIDALLHWESSRINVVGTESMWTTANLCWPEVWLLSSFFAIGHEPSRIRLTGLVSIYLFPARLKFQNAHMWQMLRMASPMLPCTL